MNQQVHSGEKSVEANTGLVRVLCAANAAYAAPLCVMLTSLVVNLSRERKIEIYVLATNIPEDDRRKVEVSLCENRSDFDLAALHWLSPDLELFKGLPTDKWIDLETYVRLLAPSVLPDDWEKVLYLDCDTVVLSDVSSLYDLNCAEGSILAARDEISSVSAPGGVFNYRELGISPEVHYFNAGVLLINLQYWREHNVADRVIDYLKLHQGAVNFWDQGGLNAILHDSWMEVDSTWNQTRIVLSPELWKKSGRSMAEWRQTLNYPKIVHYAGPYKPWEKNAGPGYSYFFKYLVKTNYRNAYKSPWLERIIGFRLHFLLRRAKTFLFWRRSPQDILRVLKRWLSNSGSSLGRP